MNDEKALAIVIALAEQALNTFTSSPLEYALRAKAIDVVKSLARSSLIQGSLPQAGEPFFDDDAHEMAMNTVDQS